MVFFNWATMQMAAKIVYYGPGLCGKTSNLSYIYAKTAPNSRGEMVSLETESDRTLFFDLLPIEVGTIGGFKTRLQLYTVPGQVFYNTTRKLVLKGVDGLVFVADSQRPMREANLESFATLRENLSELGLDMDDLPLVLQYNKRDLKNVLTLDELNEDLNRGLTLPYYESSAIEGYGVFETLKEITKLTLKKLRKRMASPQPSTSPKPRLTTAPAPAAPPPAAAAAPRPAFSASSLARAAEEGVDSGGPAIVRPPAAGRDPGPAFARPAAKPYVPPPPAPPERAAPAPEPPPIGATEPFEEVEAVAAAPVAVDPHEVTATSGLPFAETVDEVPAEVVPGEIEEVAEVVVAEPVAAAPSEAVPEPVEVEAPAATVGEERSTVEVEAPAEEPPPAVAAAPPDEVAVEFDQTGADIQPPPMKRVKVSNQLDILAELDGLRKQATMRPAAKKDGERGKDLDLDSLLGGAAVPRTRDIRQRIEEAVNSDVFARMHSVQLALHIQGDNGQVIHSFAPVSLEVTQAGELERLTLQLTVDVKNLR